MKENNSTPVITIQEYHVKSEAEREDQWVSPWSRQSLYRNLYRIADLKNTKCSKMRFWQFILAFYDFCVKTTGNTDFIDMEDDTTLRRLEKFGKEIGADDYQIEVDEGDSTGDGFDYLNDCHFTIGNLSSDEDLKIPDELLNELKDLIENPWDEDDPDKMN